MWNHSNAKGTWTAVCAISALLSAGCLAQQAELKQTERNLQQRIKQTSEESAQTRARQSQEISVLREQELPQLRGELERALHQAHELQGKQEDLKQRSVQLELQTKRLEQLAAKLDADNTTRYNQVRESLNAQDVKNKQERDQLRMDVNARLDDVSKQMEMVRKEIIEAVQKTNGGLARNLDARLEEQQKILAGLSERLSQEEQAGRLSTTHINETNKAVTGHLSEVNKSVASVAQKFAARFEEQERRLDTLSKALDQMQQDVRARGGNKGGVRPSTTKPAHRSALEPSSELRKIEQETSSTALHTQVEQGNRLKRSRRLSWPKNCPPSKSVLVASAPIESNTNVYWPCSVREIWMEPGRASPHFYGTMRTRICLQTPDIGSVKRITARRIIDRRSIRMTASSSISPGVKRYRLRS